MPGDWSEVFVLGERAGPNAQKDAPGAARGGLLTRLRESLARTREALGSEIQATLFATLDEQTWERLEEALIIADVDPASWGGTPVNID